MRWNQLLGRKSLKVLIEEMAGENRLRRALGPISLTALGVGCIIGAGIFVMTGRVAAEDAGPAVTVSYIVAATGCLFAALCYAEFAAMAPVAGSAYTYAYATLGELVAWIIGWDLILEYAMSCACVAAAWGNYLNEFLRTATKGAVEIPWWLSSDPFTTSGALFNLPAVAIMVVITIILIVGIRESALTNAVLTLIKLFVVLFVIGLGMTLVNPANWTEIPQTQRLSTAELQVEKAIGDLVRGDTPPHEMTAEQLEQISRESAYVRAKIAADRVAKLTGELLEQQKLTADDAAAQVAAAQERLASASEGVDDVARFEPIIAKIDAQAADAEVEKWGMIAKIIPPAKLKPLDDAVRSNFAPYGFSGIMLGASLVFFAFIGFDSISTHSEEAINPQRDVPIAILGSLGLCTVLYVLVAAVITGMEPYPDIDVKAAISAAFRKQADAQNSGVLRLSSLLISTGALAGMTSVLLVTFLSQARVFLAMARDKLLPHSIFGVVHPKFQTPHISTALTGLAICAAAAFTPIEALEKMVNIGTLFAFVIVCLTVLVLRMRDPHMPRPFRCPLVYLVAPMGVLVNLSMMLFLPASTWTRLAVWMAIGLVFYFLYGYRHSILGKELVTQLAKEGVGPTDAPLDTRRQ